MLQQLLGGAVPPQLRALLPPEAFQAAEFARSLLALEAQAKALRLPPSKLSPADAAIPGDPQQLYEIALPRLVALIDRSELRNTRLADGAGELLARLHATQHVTPAWLQTRARAGANLPGLGFDPGVQDSMVIERPDIQMPPFDLPPLEGEAAPFVISRSLRFADLAEEYDRMFAAAAVRPEHRDSIDWHLAMMRQSRSRYEAVSFSTGVPWHFIATVHGMEASFNFRAHFHNGDFPLSRRTRQVPAGRPLVWLPPSDWEDSTIDALKLMGFAGASDWSLARTLYRLEAYNGFGYRRIGRASPYLWSFSTSYDAGKFVADGHFEPRARSQQCGAAVMLKVLAQAGEIALS